MSKRQCLMIFGLIFIVLPFSGLPSMWKEIGYIFFGLVTIIVAYNIPVQGGNVDDGSMPFVEHKKRNDNVATDASADPSVNITSGNTTEQS
ncbi:MAG: hypothetical protein M1459_01240 [Patescibacteria group bacterium]|nr:hypothetical protein [Patescibacteria group bacterium]